MKTNKKIVKMVKPTERLAGGMGAVASKSSNLMELHRSVLSCMLWEDITYENGEGVAARIARLVPLVKPQDVSALAIEARSEANLRHVPLLIAREMARHDSHKPYVASTLSNIIQRPDEISEFLSLYWKEKKQPISNQVRKGLAMAFGKFNEYSLAKYNGDGAIKLRDVLFMVHPKPANKAQAKLWEKLANKKLKTPDTWEVELSTSKGVDKKTSWERLLSEGKMGAMALIRNLRNFEECNVDRELVKKALSECNTERVLPFRFISAVKHAPSYQVQLEDLMLRSLKDRLKFKGKTVVLIDVSGSMGGRLSSKSQMSRYECGASLAILLRELCEDVVFYATAGDDSRGIHETERISPHRGFALRDAIVNKASTLGGGGIFLKQCLEYTQNIEKTAERVIVITDEQDTDRKANPSTAPAYGKNNYIINISVEKGGIAFSKFSHINGFSERVFDYIQHLESVK